MEYRITIDDQFLINSLTDRDKAVEVLRLFYSHSIDLSCESSVLKLDILTEEQLWKIVIELLLKTPCSDIIEILRPDYTPFDIQAKDITQYSSFDDAYYKVIKFLEHSGINGVSYSKLGFMLRTKPRKEGADKKYGENHGKTAVQLGLCRLDKHHYFWPTTLGSCFEKMSEEDKENLKSKLCLYIPLIQNYFVQGQSEEIIIKHLSILTESTQKRRQPNVRRLIEIVKQSL